MPARTVLVLGRVRVRVPPQPDPGRRLRVAPEVAARARSTPAWRGGPSGERAIAPSEIAELDRDPRARRRSKYLEELGEHRRTPDGAPATPRSSTRRAAAGARTMRPVATAPRATRWFREAERLGRRARAARRPSARSCIESSRPRVVVDRTRSPRPSGCVGRARQTTRRWATTVGVGWANARLVLPLMQSRVATRRPKQAGRTAIETLEPLGEREELADALHMPRAGTCGGEGASRGGRGPSSVATIEMADRLGCHARPRRGDADARGRACCRRRRSAEADPD